MYKINLIRHPKVAVSPGICYGRLDVALQPCWQGDLGHLQEQTRESLVISSPAMRCRLLANELNPHFHVDARLQELNFGNWEGLAWNDIDRQMFDQWSANYIGRPTPNGESYLQLFQRSVDCIMEWSRQSANLTVVTHAGVIRACLSWFLRRKLAESLNWRIPFATKLSLELDQNWYMKSFKNSSILDPYPTFTPY